MALAGSPQPASWRPFDEQPDGGVAQLRRSQSIAFKEEDMTIRKQVRADAEPGSASTDPAAVARRSAEAWLDSNAELLQEVDTMTHEWARRRRETIDAVRQSLEDVRDSRELTDLLRIQQEWFTGSLRRIASDLDAWLTLVERMWRRTMLRFPDLGQSAENVQRSGDVVASASGEAALLSTAGSKPRGRPRGRPRKSEQAETVRWAETIR